MEIRDRADGYHPTPALPADAYIDPEVFDRERTSIFHRVWTCVGRDEMIPNAGDFFVEDLLGESLIIVRGHDGELSAFHNVCRHRGSVLCDGPGHVNKVFTCPYHAWSYDLEGQLVATPNVRESEGLIRAEYPLWRCRLGTWGGFIFVDVSGAAPPLATWLENEPEEPRQFERFTMEHLRLGKKTTFEVAANWKIIVDNYNECLHCPSVHKELSALVPLFRRGEVEEDPGSSTVSLRPGATSFTMSGTSSLPPLPGVTDEDINVFRGCYVFPNLMLNLTSDSVRYFILHPRSASNTSVENGYLFAEDTVRAGTDISDVAEFGELIASQDWAVCERVQRGSSSLRFRATGGVYPYQDRLLANFKERYLAAMDQALAIPR